MKTRWGAICPVAALGQPLDDGTSLMPSPEEKQRNDYRSKARAHVQAARETLKSDDAFASAYACLHARFALEALAYERLQDYLHEVSADAMDSWTPRQVLNELLYTDPDACSPIKVTIGWRPDPDAPVQEIDLGESHRFSAVWANKMHHALSSFLHQPTVKQMSESEADGREKAREKVNEALQELDRVLASALWSFRAHRLIGTQCKCGSPIARDPEFIEAGKVVSCSACGDFYNCQIDESRPGFEFWPQLASFTCNDCKTVNSMDAYELKPGKVIECLGCGEEIRGRDEARLDADCKRGDGQSVLTAMVHRDQPRRLRHGRRHAAARERGLRGRAQRAG